MANYELEPNNSISSATSISSGASITGQLSSASDRDYYVMSASGPGSIEVDLDSSSSYSRHTVTILDANGQELSSIDSYGDESFGAGIASAGQYYVLVEDSDSGYGYDTDSYELTVTAPSQSVITPPPPEYITPQPAPSAQNYVAQWSNASISDGSQFVGDVLEADIQVSDANGAGTIFFDWWRFDGSQYLYTGTSGRRYTLTDQDVGYQIVFDAYMTDLMGNYEETPTYYGEGNGYGGFEVVQPLYVPPSYSVTANRALVSEGDDVSIEVAVDNVPTGESLSWSIAGVSSGDINWPTSGTMGSGVTTFSIPIVYDGLTEGNEVMTFEVFAGNRWSPVASTSITIQDAEVGYLVSSDKSSVLEGEMVTFTVERTSSIGSSLVPYTLQGVDASDVLGRSLSGSVQLDSQGLGSLVVALAEDGITESAEQLSFVLENGVRSSVTVRDFVQTQSIESVSYENGSHLSEGFGNGVVVNYTSNDTTIRSLTFDLVADGASEAEASLTVTTDASGNASGTLRLSNDTFPEPDQTYLIQLSGNPQVSQYVQFRDDDTGNAISGGSGSEVLTTSDDDDVVDAGIGDDFVIASGGNDFIDGGAGQDAVEYQGSTSSEISLRKDGDAVVVGLSGKSDRLLDVERLHFEDQWVALDMNGNAGNAAKMIVAAFGSELLDDYLGIGIGVADDGLSMSGLANLVVNTDLMLFSTSGQFVDLVFNNLLDRDANALEKSLYSGYLDDGLYTEADLLVMAANTQMSNAYMLDFAIDNVGLPYLDTLV